MALGKNGGIEKRLGRMAIATMALLAIHAATGTASAGAKGSGAADAAYLEAVDLLRKGGGGNQQKAHGLLVEAAAQKHPDATGSLGFLYANGIHVGRDDAKALEFFNEAVRLGSGDSRLNLGLFLLRGRGGPQDLERGLDLVKQAASGGNRHASLALAEIYFFGEQSPAGAPDYSRALEPASKAAEAGLPAAQNLMGVLLRDGRNGPPDADSARFWFEKAAWQGDPKACTNLAALWNHQSGDRNARIEALRWMAVADSLGEVFSRQHLSEISPLADPAELAAAKKLALFTLEKIRTGGNLSGALR
jgi:TPR repeat protein